MSTPEVPDEQEKRAFSQRVADSAGFRNAPRLRDFLLFVTDLALSGRSAEISEQHIGHVVFHRTAEYETANDNIVRVSARQLRIKLKEYVDGEGRDDAWTLDVPKGGYIPVFTRRETAPEPVHAPEATTPATRDAGRWKIIAAVCALFAVASGVAWLNARFGAPMRDTGQSPLTNLIIRPGQHTTIVLADSSMVLLHELTGHLLTAGEYATRQPPPRPKDPSLQGLARSVASQQLTSIADVSLALRLLRVRPDAADRITVVHARNVGPRSFKHGDTILLGGPRSNPWSKLFEERLNYQFDFSGPGPSARLVNTRPRPGESAFCETERRNGVVSKSFARIALVPYLDNPGRVLLIAGASIEGTEAATEFFLGQRSEALLSQALGREPSATRGFEILLETTAIDGAPGNSRIVGARLLE